MKKIFFLFITLCYFSFTNTTLVHAESESFYLYDCTTQKEDTISIENWERVSETPSNSLLTVSSSLRQQIGDCNLIKIEDTTATKATRAAVQLIAIFPNGTPALSSGIMIGPSTLLTAAHCVYNESNGGYAKKITINPARNLDKYPYGSTTANRISIPSSYKTTINASTDIAVVNLTSAIGKKSGYLPCKVASASELTSYYAIVEYNGYPESGHQTDYIEIGGKKATTKSGEMWGMGASVISVNGKMLKHIGDTFPGHSGSGLIYQSQYVVGVHNRYPTKDKTYNMGCHIDSEYLKWINGLIK